MAVITVIDHFPALLHMTYLIPPATECHYWVKHVSIHRLWSLVPGYHYRHFPTGNLVQNEMIQNGSPHLMICLCHDDPVE